MKLGMRVGLGAALATLCYMGTQPPPPKGHCTAPTQFSAHICYGQMAAWIKMPLGMELGLSPGDFVLDGDPAPSPKGCGAPFSIFGPFLLWPNGWMHQHATWYGGRPQPRGLCVRWGPSPPPKFSARVCYSYCEFVRTLHSCYWFVHVQVQVLVLYAFYF